MSSLTKEQIMSIVDLRETMTNVEIAGHLGCSRATVIRWTKALKEAGYDVPERKRGRPKIL